MALSCPLGMTAVSRKKIVFFYHIINALLIKLVQSRWLAIGLVVLFIRDYGPRRKQKRTWPISSHIVLTLDKLCIFVNWAENDGDMKSR